MNPSAAQAVLPVRNPGPKPSRAGEFPKVVSPEIRVLSDRPAVGPLSALILELVTPEPNSSVDPSVAIPSDCRDPILKEGRTMDRGHKKTLRTLETSHVSLRGQIRDTLRKIKEISPSSVVPASLRAPFREQYQLLLDLTNRLEANLSEHQLALTSSGSWLEARTIEGQVDQARQAVSGVYHDCRLEDTPPNPLTREASVGNSPRSPARSGHSQFSLRRDLRLQLAEEEVNLEFRQRKEQLAERSNSLQSQIENLQRQKHAEHLRAQRRLQESMNGRGSPAVPILGREGPSDLPQGPTPDMNTPLMLRLCPSLTTPP